MILISSADAESPLTIHLFGPMQVRIDGRPLPHLRSRKGLWLLALLILRHSRPVEREWLAGTLWPDTDPNSASTNLRANLSDLRRALGDQSARLRSPSRHTLTLELEGAQVDLHRFDHAMKRKDLEALRQAISLYHGPLLEDCAEEWIGQERNAREQDCLQALQILGDASLAAGDHAAAIDCFRRAVGIDPWRETARRAWMETLAKSGDRNAALQVYREYVELLRADPTAVPDDETSALYGQLRNEARRQARPQAADARGATVVNAARSPSLSSSLPHPLTELIGREQERIAVAAQLRRSRLVTLTGPGGIGKTRLALEIARDAAEDGAAYPDGVWLVALDSLSDAKRVSAQAAAVLGLRETPGRALLESLTDHLREKRLLLVLDNCEHLLEASAHLAAHLLRACARVRLLVTSREAMRITGEHVWQVPSLATPDTTHLPPKPETMLRTVASYESVRLFVERAQANRTDFLLTESNAPAVAQLCSQLEGIPLAIELAAARVIAMTVEQMVARLHDRLSLLTGGSRIAQSRQQTLRATLDWSYALLSEPERRLLHRLSVFVGGWSLEAAEHVCGGSDLPVLDLLTALVAKSLVTFQAPTEETGGRYRLLEIVRQYALQRLEASGEAPQVRSRHREWFIALAEAMKLTEADPRTSLKRLETEYANLRAAMDDCRDDPQGAEAGLQLSGALGRFFYLHGYYTEGRRYLEEALARDAAQAPTAIRARALNGAGVLAGSQSDPVAAQSLMEESLRIYREQADWPRVAVLTGNLGIVYCSLGKFADARALYEDSLQRHRDQGDTLGMARTLNSLGTLASKQGEYALAQEWLSESLNLRRESGDRRGIAVAGNNLGDVALSRGDYPLAHALCAESLQLNRELNDRHGMAISLSYLGLLAFRQGDYALAQAHYDESLGLFQELNDRAGIANMWNQLGELAEEQGRYAEAHGLYTESLDLYRALNEKRGIALCLDSLASLLLTRAEAATAVRLRGTAAALRDALGVPLPPSAREKYERQQAQARCLLGDETFAACWAEGRRLPWEQAVAFVTGARSEATASS